MGALFPDRPEPFYYRACALRALGQSEDARDELDRLEKLRLRFPPAQALRRMLAPGIPGERDEVEPTASTGPFDIEELWSRTQTAASQGDWKLAEAAYSALLLSHGTARFIGADLDAQLGRGIARVEIGDHDGAVRDFMAAHGRWPRAVAPIILTGVAYLSDSGRLDCGPVEGWFQEALSSLGETPFTDLLVLEMVGTLKEYGCLRGALACLDRMPAGFLRDRARMEVLKLLGRRDEAAAAGEAALSHDPEDALSIVSYAGVLSGIPRRAEEAKHLIEKAVELEPSHPEVQRLAADAYLELREYPQARQTARRAFDLDRASHAALVTLTECLLWLEEYDEMERLLRDLERDDPRHPYALYLLGFLRTRFGEYDEAIELYRESIRGTPEKGNAAHVRLAHLLSQLGREEEAEKEYRETMAAFPTNLYAQWMCAQLLQGQGRNDEALKLYAESTPRRLVPPTGPLGRLADLLRWDPQVQDRTPIDRFIDGYESRGDTEKLPPVALQPLALAWLRSPTRPDEDRALHYATRAVELSGRWDAACLATLAAVQRERGDLADAVLSLEEAASLGTISVEDQERLKLCRAALYPRIVSLASADALLAERSAQETTSLTREATAAAGGEGELIRAYLDARELQLAGKPEAALARFQSLAESFEEEPALLLRAAECLEATGNSGEAETLLSSALSPRFAAIESRRELIADLLTREQPADLLQWLGRDPLGEDLRFAESLVQSEELDRAQDFLLWKVVGQSSRWDAPWVAWWRLFSSRGVTIEACLDELPFRPGTLGRSPVCFAETFEGVLQRLAQGQTIRIDAGARPRADSQYDLRGWESDFAYVFGGPSNTKTGSPGSSRLPYTGEVHETDEDDVYRTLRTFRTGRPAGYRIPLMPWRYAVTVHLCEVKNRARDRRRFDVEIEGETLFEDVEPLAGGFATAIRRTRDVILTDALLEVTVKARKGMPQIAAVEVQLLGR